MEMDERRMTAPWTIGLHLAAGLGVGLWHFHTLWWSVRRLAQSIPAQGIPVRGALIAILARFAILLPILALTSLEGALPLLATAAGILAGRMLVLHRVRGRWARGMAA